MAKFLALFIVLSWTTTVCYSYGNSYSQPDFSANVTVQNPPVLPPPPPQRQPPSPPVLPPPRQPYNTPYKSAYIYPSLPQSHQKPPLLFVDAPAPYHTVNQAPPHFVTDDQATTEATPSGIWKIFSIFSLPNLPNFFSQKPEETSTDANKPGYNYQAPPSLPQNEPPPAYYNYAVVQQELPSGGPATTNYYYHQTGRYPLYQVPAPGSKYTVPPPSSSSAGRYPPSYSYHNGKPYYSQSVSSYYHPSNPNVVFSPLRPTSSTPVLEDATTPITTSSTIVPQLIPTSAKPLYYQQQLPAYSIYLVPAKPPAYYHPSPSQDYGKPTNYGHGYNNAGMGHHHYYNQHQSNSRPTYSHYDPSNYYGNYPGVNPDAQFQRPTIDAAAPTSEPHTATKTTPDCDCDKNTTAATTTTTTAATTTIASRPSTNSLIIANASNDRNDVDVNGLLTTPGTQITPEEQRTTTTEPAKTSSIAQNTLESRRLFANRRHSNEWVPVV